MHCTEIEQKMIYVKEIRHLALDGFIRLSGTARGGGSPRCSVGFAMAECLGCLEGQVANYAIQNVDSRRSALSLLRK